MIDSDPGDLYPPPVHLFCGPRRTFVVLDTTEMRGFNADRFNSPDWRRLLSYSSQDLLLVIVPDVVVRETVRHHQRDVRAARREGTKSFNEASKLFSRVGIKLTDRTSELRKQADARAASFDPWLRESLADADVIVVDNPGLSHRRLLDWALAERQPFKDTGEGYRDALIWATVLELLHNCDSESRVWFVTDNVTDFFNSTKDGLGDALAGDVAELGDCGTVEMFRTLKDLLASRNRELASLTHAREREELTDSLPDARFDVMTAVIARCEDLDGDAVSEENFNDIASANEFPRFLEDISFSSVEALEDTFDFQAAEELDGGTLVGTATISAMTELTARVPAGLTSAAAEILGGIEQDEFGDGAWVTLDPVELEFTWSVTVTADAGEVDTDFDSFRAL